MNWRSDVRPACLSIPPLQFLSAVRSGGEAVARAREVRQEAAAPFRFGCEKRHIGGLTLPEIPSWRLVAARNAFQAQSSTFEMHQAFVSVQSADESPEP